jgi:hypothetical protein
VSIVRFWAAKLIVRLAGTKRSVGKILQLTTPALIAEKNVKLAIGPKPEHTTVVVAALHRIGGILLDCAKPNDIFI